MRSLWFILLLSKLCQQNDASFCAGNVENKNQNDDALNSRRTKRQQASPHSNSGAWHSGEDVHRKWRYIEAYVVVSRSLFAKYEMDERRIYFRFSSVVAYANGLFRPLNITIIVVGMHTTNDNSLSSNDKTYLLQQLERESDIIKTTKDITILFTEALMGETVGYANVGEMCNCRGKSLAIVADEGRHYASVGRTLAHETGHTLGMKHFDVLAGCECIADHCVMAGKSQLGTVSNLAWSECSAGQLAKRFNTGQLRCLENFPSTVTNLRACGNFIVEPGEQCDCGLPEFCNNPCCNSTTCMLHSNATCASGSCCNTETCHPKKAGTTCRLTTSECDLPEFCSGHSERCPDDFYKADGTPCTKGEGYCASGRCGNLDWQCARLLGPSAKQATQSCFKSNDRGGISGGCSADGSRCDEASIMCGTIKCEAPMASQEYLSKIVSFKAPDGAGHCLSFSVLECQEMAHDGVACGSNQMCINNKCLPIPRLIQGDCVSNCSGNGVCNNKYHCHCNDAFASPDCISPGYGGSVDSGYSADPNDNLDVVQLVFILFLIIIPFISLPFCFCKIMYLWWIHEGKVILSDSCSICAVVLDKCCCVVAGKIVGHLPIEKVIVEEDVTEAGDLRRKTICQVSIDIKPPEAHAETWGVASDRLITDVIEVTPKNTPDTKRKVRLDSGEGLQSKPMLHFSVSRTSSLDECDASTRPSSPVSFGSLLSVCKKYKPPNSREPSLCNEPLDRPLQSQAKKNVPLSRMLLDPMTYTHGALQRSLSSEPQSGPNFLPILSEKFHKSEQNIASQSLEINFNGGQRNTSATHFENTSESQNQIAFKIPMLPKALPGQGILKNK